jgi:hypothetical protein
MRDTVRRSSVVLTIAIAIAGCSKSTGDASPTAGSASTPLAVASAAPSASAAKPAGPQNTAWSGSYVAKVGAVAPPENAKEKTWTNDPGTAAVGPGTVALSVAGAGGATRGSLSGPLGDLEVSGVFDGTELRASLAPKDPKADPAMTGFMVLTGSGGPPPSTLKGTLRVSNGDARVVREAAVELARK